MEMSWLETVEFIGLDLQVGLILALVGLDLLKRVLHAAWSAFSQRRTVNRAGYSFPSVATHCATDSSL